MKIYYSCAFDNRNITMIKNDITKLENLIINTDYTLVSSFDYYSKSSKDIVTQNLAQIIQCDILICDLSSTSHHYVGCIGELIYAKILNKTTFVIVGNSEYKNRPWITYHADKEFYSLEELLVWLKNSDAKKQ